MVKGMLRRWRKPPPMLVFMLAVMLPAAALIVASVVWLTHISAARSLREAIESDYEHILKIAEKRIVERIYDTSERASTDFPIVDHPEELDDFSNRPSGNHPRISLDWERQP